MPLEDISTVAIVEDMLPPATFHILLALADDDRHGYAIIQDIAARTGGELKLSAGTLYRSSACSNRASSPKRASGHGPRTTMSAVVTIESPLTGRRPRRRKCGG
jgi:hypothetical protein